MTPMDPLIEDSVFITLSIELWGDPTPGADRLDEPAIAASVAQLAPRDRKRLKRLRAMRRSAYALTETHCQRLLNGYVAREHYAGVLLTNLLNQRHAFCMELYRLIESVRTTKDTGRHCAPRTTPDPRAVNSASRFSLTVCRLSDLLNRGLPQSPPMAQVAATPAI